MSRVSRASGLSLIVQAVSLALPGSARSEDVLLGVWPTCWKPWEVHAAYVAAGLRGWDKFHQYNCGLWGANGNRVRVLRCAANVTGRQVTRFAGPVPRDAELPDDVCEVGMFVNDELCGIYYTFHYNIMQTE